MPPAQFYHWYDVNLRMRMLGIETKKVVWLIKNHMVMLHMKNKLAEVKTSTLEKYLLFNLIYFSLFKIMDDDGSKKLSFDEFKKGVEEYGLNFSRNEIDELFRLFDADRSGSIDYEEFLRKLRVCFFF